MSKQPPTITVFRVWRDSGEVIALFPEVASDPSGLLCDSYMHVGQHGSAAYADCIRASRPAARLEYAPLASELMHVYGYRLDVRRRASRLAYARRRQMLASILD